MKILLTGGSGDLGKVLSARIEKKGDIALRLDIRKPTDNHGKFLQGSILDRERLSDILPGVDCIVHIAAWHGFHEFTKQKNVDDFWDVNVTGTFTVFQAALETNVKNIIFISSEAVSDPNGNYGWTKVLGEQIAQRYAQHHHLNVLTLRPRAFIPYWNKQVYQSFVEWAQWYWKGAVHINDVADAVLQGVNLLSEKPLNEHLVLPVDGKYDYTKNDLENWDQAGAGSTFKKYYAEYYDLALQHGLQPDVKPTMQDISETKKWLGYEPQYSMRNLLAELSQYGEAGPSIIEPE